MGDENRISRDRASRSRSKTPFLRSSCDRELCKIAGGSTHSESHQFQVQYQESLTAVAESHDEGKNQTFSLKYSDTFLGTASVIGGAKFLRKRKSGGTETSISQKKLASLRQINGVYRNSKERDNTSASVTTLPKNTVDGKTSDYSSEEGENIHQEAHRAFQLYKDTGDWWNAFPKTDYTYSEYSTHRREIAPGVVNMPNMSRSGLRTEDAPSPRREYTLQNLRNVGSSGYDRTRYSSTYSRSGGNVRDERWERVLGAEYTANRGVRQDHSFLHETRTNITRIFTSIFYFVTYVTTCFKSISSFWSSSYYPEHRHSQSSSGNIRAKLFQGIYRLLVYAKILDTWLLMGWKFSSTFSRRMLFKLFFILLPTFLLAGIWAYVQFWPDQGVSNSVSKPEPNQPQLTSNSKIASTSADQDFESYSILKILSGSFASSLRTFWIWLLYPLVSLNRTNKIVTSGDVHIHVPRVDSTQKMEAEKISPSEIDMDKLASKIINNQVFLTLLSSTYTGPVEDRLSQKIDNIYLKLNEYHSIHMAESASKLKYLDKTIDAGIATSLDGIKKANEEVEARLLEKISKLGDEQQMQLLKLKKMAQDIDDVVTQTKFLKTLIQEESALRESLFIGLTEDLHKWKEKFSIQSSSIISNQDHINMDFSESKMKKIVNDALMLYDADKTGLTDYALESSGGSIVSTRCTETYHAKTAVLGWFKFKFWYMSNTPRTIIQHGVHPGECWAFKGSQGYVVIKLSHKIQVSMVSLEHIPKVLSPLGIIDSAPKNFSFWGLDHETDTEGQLIGKYAYDQNGSSLQFFPVEKDDLPPYQFVELRVESNHGNLEYTCIYRLRVHGVVPKEGNRLIEENR